VSATLLTSLIALFPMCLLLAGAATLFFRARTANSLLQLIGSLGLVVVVLAHVCEALQIFPWVHWGMEHSIGHYIDLSAALLGVTLFPVGYLLHAVTKH